MTGGSAGSPDQPGGRAGRETGLNRWGEPWLDPLIAFLLGAAALALYIRTLAPDVLPADAGELQFAPYLLGVVHPTGYPLYSLLGWAWSHLLPVGTVAYRMNLFSAVWAALAVALLYPTALSLLRQTLPGLRSFARRLTASLAAAAFAVTPTFWSQAVIAEVYSLNALLVVLLLYLVLTWGEAVLTLEQGGGDEARYRLLLATCVFGLSLTHHRTTVLLLPGLLAYAWLVDRGVFRQPRLMLTALLLALAPLLLYLYIPWRAARTPYLHVALGPGWALDLYDNTLRGFLAFVLGRAYGGSLDLGASLGSRLSLAAGLFRHELGWAGLGLGLVGVAALVAGRHWRVLALTGLAFLALVGFNLVYTIGDVVVLFIPAFLILALWMAAGVGTLAGLVGRLPGLRGGLVRALPIALAAIALALPANLAATHIVAIDQSSNTQARATWQAILSEPLPQDAILVSNDRDEIMPLWYYQTVGDGAPERPGWLGLFPLITPDYCTLGQILDLALSTGRPAYLVKEMPGIEVKVQVRPEGRLWRIIGPSAGAEPVHRMDAALGGTVLMVGYDLAPAELRPGDPLQVSLLWEALGPLEDEYHSYVHLLGPAGDRVAQSDRQPGGVYYPTSLWGPAERLRDDHTLNVPADAAAGTYRLVAGMYRLAAAGGLTALGEPVMLGEVQVR